MLFLRFLFLFLLCGFGGGFDEMDRASSNKENGDNWVLRTLCTVSNLRGGGAARTDHSEQRYKFPFI